MNLKDLICCLLFTQCCKRKEVKCAPADLVFQEVRALKYECYRMENRLTTMSISPLLSENTLPLRHHTVVRNQLQLRISEYRDTRLLMMSNLKWKVQDFLRWRTALLFRNVPGLNADIEACVQEYFVRHYEVEELIFLRNL